jgi:uncharacterized protein HemX
VGEPTNAFRVRPGVAMLAQARRGLPARLSGLLLVAGLALGACSFQFGSGAEPSSDTSEEANRERNRLYQQEQMQMERQRQFDRIGPSDR